MRQARWILSLVVIGLMLSSIGLVSAQVTGTISGTVTDADTNGPIQEALVEVEGTDLSAETDGDGNYTIADVPEGTYNVTASADEYEAETESDVEVTAGDTTVDFALQPLVTTGTISGTVTDADTSEPVQGASVEVEGTALSAETDADGNYTIADVPAGTHNVTASADGYEGETESDVEVTEGDVTVDFALQPLDTEEEAVAGKRKGFVGTVEEMTEGSFALIQQGTGGQVTIGLPDEYVLKTPGGPRTTGTFEDGARVAVLAQLVDDQWIAVQVLVKPVKPTAPPGIGVVVSSNEEEGTFTIMTPSGNTHTLRLPPGKKAPTDGELITVFPEHPLQADGEEDGDGPPRATGLVRAAEVSQRLQNHLEQLTADDGAMPGGDQESKAERIASQIQLLEAHAMRHIAHMDAVLERVPEKAKAAIQRAKANAERGQQQAQAAIQQARGKIGPPEGKGQSNKPENGGNTPPNKGPK